MLKFQNLSTKQCGLVKEIQNVCWRALHPRKTIFTKNLGRSACHQVNNFKLGCSFRNTGQTQEKDFHLATHKHAHSKEFWGYTNKVKAIECKDMWIFEVIIIFLSFFFVYIFFYFLFLLHSNFNNFDKVSNWAYINISIRGANTSLLKKVSSTRKLFSICVKKNYVKLLVTNYNK